jgi:DNA-binding MarR family transcriptional regulator
MSPADVTPAAADTSAPDDVAAEARDLRMATFRLARRLRSHRAIDSMSDGQFSVLAALKTHGPHTLGELAERERVTAPSMNRTVNCLEESGWLTRTPDEADRRKVIIDLTAEGRAIVEETVRRRDAWLETVLAELAPADRATIAAATAIMLEAAGR